MKYDSKYLGVRQISSKFQNEGVLNWRLYRQCWHQLQNRCC